MIFITGYAANAAIGKGVLAPGMEILIKPFSLEVLAAKVNAMACGADDRGRGTR